MVAEYGMGRTLDLATFPRPNWPLFSNQNQAPLVAKEYSETTMAKLDEEIKWILTEGEKRVKECLGDHKDLLVKVAQRLLQTKIVGGEEFEPLIDKTKTGLSH